jgi:predicted lipid-binding transport protein (Tim44 family)
VERDKLVNDLAARLEQRTQARSDAVVRRWPRFFGALLAGTATGTLVVPFLDGVAQAAFFLLTVLVFGVALWEICGLPLRRRHVREQGDQLRHEAVATLAKALQQREEFFEQWHEDLLDLAALTRWGGTPSTAVRE